MSEKNNSQKQQELAEVFIESADISRERKKARQLRHTSWWKRKCSQGLCYYCQKKISPQLLTMDHIIPLMRGGLSIKINLVPCCKKCNNAKKNHLPTDAEWTV